MHKTVTRSSPLRLLGARCRPSPCPFSQNSLKQMAWPSTERIPWPISRCQNRSGQRGSCVNWNGVTWHFASGENRQCLNAIPKICAPIWRALCLCHVQRIYCPTVPEAWTIYEDRLYLNFSLRARELWLQDVPGKSPWGMRIGPSLS